MISADREREVPAMKIGHLTAYITDGPIDDPTLASAMDMIPGEARPVVIDGSQVQSCSELEHMIARTAETQLEHGGSRNFLVSNLLDVFYDNSIPTREASQILGRVKSTFELLVENGAQIVVLCQRRSADLGTRSHFVASLCASADRVHFRRST